MLKEVYKVIDSMESSAIVKRLDEIKKNIKNDKEAMELINKFNDAKELYSKYNLKDEFLVVKTNLLNNELIKSFVEIQNEINMLALYINSKIDNLTKDTI